MRKQVNASAAMSVISAAYVPHKEEQFEDLMWHFMASRVLSTEDFWICTNFVTKKRCQRCHTTVVVLQNYQS